MSDPEIKQLTDQLNLIPHPEGGAFREMWRGERMVTFTEETAHGGPRNVGTNIYYMLKAPNFISWHKVLSDEFFYWHAGGTAKVHFLDKDGKHSSVLLGDVLKNPECAYQVLVPHEMWYACELVDREYVLYSATVMPGFEFKDWLEGKRSEMIQQFPQHEDLITRLTKH
ncbi:uncharacterized protein [Haliotis cracherodii]|uniref:uncharacterized protein n=1 Tax=Haliotis cracherodii TaxID=6455 RepID=UPI0039E937AE